MSSPPASPISVLMLVGPTASGKTAAALHIAQNMPIEVISVDSGQVYRELNIGTAKPTMIERAAVTHHLIDIIDPSQRYSAGQFTRDATKLIQQIHQRGNIPLLAGGTMLYFKALAEGLSDLPQANPTIREQLEREADEKGWPALHKRLMQDDPDTAARLEPTDAQRIQRALEVLQTTGTPMSVLLQSKRHSPGRLFRYIRVSLEPGDRSVLHQRIENRFQAMIENGFIDEVAQLRRRSDLHASLPAIRSVGYRQLWQWFDRGAKSTDKNEAIQAGIAATRQLAKRQLTWLRRMPEKAVIDCLAPSAANDALSVFQDKISYSADNSLTGPAD